MDNRDEVRDFLTSRRDRLTPRQAGIPLYGGRRRVKGLRREEVAMLAGMSTDYYTAEALDFLASWNTGHRSDQETADSPDVQRRR